MGVQTSKSVEETVRTTDEFPAGSECDLTIDDLPDDEDDFWWTKHYEEETRPRQNPDVTDEIVDRLLSDGVVRQTFVEQHDDRYLVQLAIDADDVTDRLRYGDASPDEYEWTLVVARDDVDRDSDHACEWALVTIYSNYHGSIGVTNRYFDRLSARRGD